MRKKLVILTGSGISEESGIKTFRDHNGLWENYRIEDVASLKGFNTNPSLVLDFYNQRRRQLKEVVPNLAHLILADLEKYFDVSIITQNVDDLHERAGSSKILHLHGELLKVCPIDNFQKTYQWSDDLNIGDVDHRGKQLRPYIVWFGENVTFFDDAIELCSVADLLIIIGTSMQVYPASSLIDYVPHHCEIFVIDPLIPNKLTHTQNHFAKKATEGMLALSKRLVSEYL